MCSNQVILKSEMKRQSISSDFKAIYLCLDSGTGPDHRGLIIWDLGKKKKVYTGTWKDEEVNTKPSYMEFWLETGRATDENCPEAKKWRAQGLGAAIETWVRVDLSDFTITKSSKTRCSSRQ